MPASPSTALLWFRRDLRLTDQAALHAALRSAERVIPIYIHAPEEEAPWTPGAASRWWLHHSLEALDEKLRTLGSRLVVRTGPTLQNLRLLIKETGARTVVWNRLYEPALVARDRDIKAALRSEGIEAVSHNGALLLEPWELLNKQGLPFRVFTPFWRAAQRRFGQATPLRAPKSLPSVPQQLSSVTVQALRLLPKIHWDAGLAKRWRVGEAHALKRLRGFCAQGLPAYATERDRPDHAGTSSLSPHLHFGELSPRQILAETAQAPHAEVYLREIGWREFAHYLLYHFPHTAEQALDPRFERFPWEDDTAALHAWQQGRTGIPLVDAGMRQLWHTGWMHNRVRMVVASMLTKNLRVHWLQGARWFWDTLVDADLANNTLGWQWTAGCGADAAPYFRVFNPVLQAERCDPGREYIRLWVPELARLANKWIHQPWKAPVAELNAAGIELGRDYPTPIVSLSASREAALAAYARLSKIKT